MSEECGTCVWYDGDFRDLERFCDEKEEFVCWYNWCVKYRQDKEKLELMKRQIGAEE